MYHDIKLFFLEYFCRLLHVTNIIFEKTKFGILLPDTASKERPEQGVVIAVGPGKKTDDGKIVPVSVMAGHKVLFTKYGPNEIKIDGKEYLIAREDDILAIIE